MRNNLTWAFGLALKYKRRRHKSRDSSKLINTVHFDSHDWYKHLCERLSSNHDDVVYIRMALHHNLRILSKEWLGGCQTYVMWDQNEILLNIIVCHIRLLGMLHALYNYSGFIFRTLRFIIEITCSKEWLRFIFERNNTILNICCTFSYKLELIFLYDETWKWETRIYLSS